MRKEKIIIPIVIVLLIVIMWVTRILPSGFCILTAANYVEHKYPDRSFKYSFIEYSSVHEAYFVHFADKDDNKLAIMTYPFRVWYDPLDPPG